MSVGWFGGWAKSYVQVEYANMLNLGHIFVFWLIFIDYIAVSALKMLKACLSIFFQFCRILLFLNFIEFIA